MTHPKDDARNPIALACRATVESLEARTHLAVTPIPDAPSALLPNGTLLIQGTTRGDNIRIERAKARYYGDSLKVTVNRDVQYFSRTAITNIRAYGFAGSDLFVISEAGGSISAPSWFIGANGNDTAVGGSGKDTLIGGRGADRLEGNANADWIEGNADPDFILGGGDVDTIFGNEGADIINTGLGDDAVKGTEAGDQVDTGAAANAQPLKKSRWSPQPLRKRTRGRGTPAAFNGTVVGYTPEQVRNAYGFGDLTDDTFTNRGAGQTIAVVVAHHYPTAREDLNTFSDTFGLPRVTKKTFGVLYASGNQPTIDGAWAAEAALDLQWAHAIAPEARLVLVEADSSLTSDLFNAVAKATNLVNEWGGGVVAMSFGTPESLADSQFVTQFRNVRTHNVSYVAAAGNTAATVFYPAADAEVLSVGGTFLPLDADGTLTGPETAWNGGGGGLSSFVERPSYQDQLLIDGVSIGNTRAVPDVAYNADPLSAYAVFSTTPNENGDTGWQAIGGTSAGTPQWAGIVALANQQRIDNGLEQLGNGQLNNFIYGLARKSQDTYFNDINIGSNGNPAAEGFDLATGWGTPKASAIIDALGTATSRKNPVSARTRVDFNWQGNFTRELITPLFPDTPAVANFFGRGNVRATPTQADLYFPTNETFGFGAGGVAGPTTALTMDGLNLTRTGNTIEGRGNAFVLLDDGTPGIFLVKFSGRIYRSFGRDEVIGEFYAISSRGRILQQGVTPIFRGEFGSELYVADLDSF